MSSDDDPRDALDELAARDDPSYDGHTVAVPLTQEQAIRIMQGAIDDAEPGHEAECVAALVPEVLAAAMGAYLDTVNFAFPGMPANDRRVIVLPSREVSRGD